MAYTHFPIGRKVQGRLSSSTALGWESLNMVSGPKKWFLVFQLLVLERFGAGKILTQCVRVRRGR